MSLSRLVVHAATLTITLGSATFAVWLLVGREAFQGGYANVLADRGTLVYATLAIAWMLIGYAAGRWPWSRRRLSTVALVTTLSWLDQGALLAMFGQLLDSDLRTAMFRVGIWLTATGLLLQPVAVFAGAWVGIVRATKASQRSSASPNAD